MALGREIGSKPSGDPDPLNGGSSDGEENRGRTGSHMDQIQGHHLELVAYQQVFLSFHPERAAFSVWNPPFERLPECPKPLIVADIWDGPHSFQLFQLGSVEWSL